MVDLNKFKIYQKDSIDNDYFIVIIEKKINEFSSVQYYTDGQISSLLNMMQKEYTNALNGQFKCKSINHTTSISKDTDFNQVKDLLESFLLMNKIR